MTKTITISLSLGSGPKAEELAARIKSAAGSMPISEFVRLAVADYLTRKHDPVVASK